jgi:hypothetical protein
VEARDLAKGFGTLFAFLHCRNVIPSNPHLLRQRDCNRDDDFVRGNETSGISYQLLTSHQLQVMPNHFIFQKVRSATIAERQLLTW